MSSEANGKSSLETFPLWIDGATYKSHNVDKFAVFSAKEGKDVHFAQSATAEVAEQAAESAARAMPAWESQFSCSARREILERFAGLIETRQQELVDAQVQETSTSETWARFNIEYSVGMIREIAARVTAVCTGEMPPMSATGTFGMVIRKPIGVVLLIAPWNASVILASRSLASILAAGCTVVFKASELCPKVHHLLLELLIEAGVPANVVSVIQTSREDAGPVTEALIVHPAIRKIEFIGSAPVGRIIGSLAGKYLKPVLMELGGKCAAVVLRDADLNHAAEKCITGGFINHGQVCFSTERIIVEKQVADDFIALLKQKANVWPQDRGVSARIIQAAHDKLADAHAKGATFLLGEPAYTSKTSLAPAILTNVTKDMDMWDEETFGPSTTVIVVDGEEEAIKVVNESKYGLDAFLFTRDMKKAVDIARRLEVGRVRVNSSGHERQSTFPTAPVKNSGWGTNNAGHGIEEFLVKQVVTMDFR
ncbi:hypothetical protein M409DRAFT_37130 [Zasmidium cellare ATCC 36951]|uniref:Aldehyde dehydrogenase domain-containing protein n=1 Tax=Zasmidium cellare ATCC 36951 TaxID=1080233 RepID=A0A6A6C9Y2_ZASCE|nr:uncharacterized protein M409DRAFT_37130 [Zasmidium cellare ATCC 36951]KAF2163954.1 hypothetical protein M409DRAFT_37130 [Zasmidium cellare ATCC 36951]